MKQLKKNEMIEAFLRGAILGLVISLILIAFTVLLISDLADFLTF